MVPKKWKSVKTFAFGGPCDVQKRVKVYKVYVSWKPWLYSLRRHQKKWFLSNWGRTRCNRSAQGLKMANCTSFKILTHIWICMLFGMSLINSFTHIQENWKFVIICVQNQWGVVHPWHGTVANLWGRHKDFTEFNENFEKSYLLNGLSNIVKFFTVWFLKIFCIKWIHIFFWVQCSFNNDPSNSFSLTTSGFTCSSNFEVTSRC